MKICPVCGLRYPNDATQCFVDRAALQEAPDPHIGKLVAGRYRVEHLLGEGGMASVYAARATLQDRPVAIKFFRKDLARDPKLRERFRREATSSARLAHPNIIEILDSGEMEDGTPFLVMEMLVGESLESLLSKGKPPLWRTVDINIQVMQGIARAHDFQVIHRDLKPDNLFVCRGPDGRDVMKILDFGIARSMHDPRLTGAGEIFGTPQYMAPERITSIDAGPAADLYAMGVILYQMATGQLPFDAEDISGFLLKHLREQPPPPRSVDPTIPPMLESLILQMLEKDPARRPVDAHAVGKALSTIAATLPKPVPVSVPPPAPMPPSSQAHSPLLQGAGSAQRGSKNTLAPATLERWERRVGIFGQMLNRAFPGGRAAPELVQMLDRVRVSVAKMNDVRARSLREQARLEAIESRTREGQTRFGRAMDALGQDVSRVRQELQAARELDRQYEEHLQKGSAPFRAAHAKLSATPADPTPELMQQYRVAVEALERALLIGQERSRAAAYLASKEREEKDTAFQIEALRAQLQRVSQAGEEERAQVQKGVEQFGAELHAVEQSLINDASALANALRDRAELGDLFRELEVDAA